MIGLLQFLAPEYVLHDAHTPAVDVYSFGLVLYQLCTLQSPKAMELSPNRFQHRRKEMEKHWTARFHQEDVSQEIRKELYHLMSMCSFEPADRPTWDELYEAAEKILSVLPAESPTDFCKQHCNVLPLPLDEDFL